MIQIGKNQAIAILEGNLTADPELKKVGNGKVVTTFSIAVNHSWDDSDKEEDVSFIDVEAWDKIAELCAEYLRKGRSVSIIGQIRQDRWKTPEGANRNKVKIVVLGIRFNRMERPAQKEKKAA